MIQSITHQKIPLIHIMAILQKPIRMIMKCDSNFRQVFLETKFCFNGNMLLQIGPFLMNLIYIHSLIHIVLSCYTYTSILSPLMINVYLYSISLSTSCNPPGYLQYAWPNVTWWAGPYLPACTLPYLEHGILPRPGDKPEQFWNCGEYPGQRQYLKFVYSNISAHVQSILFLLYQYSTSNHQSHF